MITVVQRVTEASVTVDQQMVGKIGRGLVALTAVCKDDTEADVKWKSRKLAELRIFPSMDGTKHFEMDVRAVRGEILVVSNFTVAGDARQGRRPSFAAAADAEKGARYFASLIDELRAAGVSVRTGKFRADMSVHLVNDGPVTLVLDSSTGV